MLQWMSLPMLLKGTGPGARYRLRGYKTGALWQTYIFQSEGLCTIPLILGADVKATTGPLFIEGMI